MRHVESKRLAVAGHNEVGAVVPAIVAPIR